MLLSTTRVSPGRSPLTRNTQQRATRTRQRDQSSRAPVCAMSTAALTPPPQPQPPFVAWFEQCMKDVVRNLEDEPFLELVSRHGRRSRISGVARGDREKVWSKVLPGSGLVSPQAVVYVHRLQAAPDNLSGSLSRSSLEDVRLSSAEHEKPCASNSAKCNSKPAFCPCRSLPPAVPGREVRFFGVVVQSHHGDSSESSCYVLKTVKQWELSGVHSTHFSLTRVGGGEDLTRQQLNAWLA